MSDAPRTIFLSERSGVPGERTVAAAQSILPGMLVDYDASGDLIVHAGAGGNAAKRFAVSDPTATGSPPTATAYTAGVRAKYRVAGRGETVEAKLASDAAAIVIGNPVESAGDGTVRVHTAQLDTDGVGTPAIPTDRVVGWAVEAVDNSGAGTTTHIQIEVA